MTAWGRVSQPTHGAPWDQEGLLSECLLGQSWRVVHNPESPGTRAWLCHPQSPALLESSPVTCWPMDLHTGSVWSLDPLPIVLLVAWVLTLLPTIPCTVAVWLFTHNPLLPWSLALLPIIPFRLKIYPPWHPCRPGNHITHSFRSPRSDHRGGGPGFWGSPLPLWTRGTSHRGMGGLDLSRPHLEKVRYLLRPLDWAQAAPPWRAWGRLAGGGWAVCPSVSTHHRAQSLFPRLKPSQLKSSKPRVVGATPPPVEERDRCSREEGRGGGPCKACWRPMPHPGHAPAAPHHLPQPRAHGQLEQDSEKTGGGQGRQKQPPW